MIAGTDALTPTLDGAYYTDPDIPAAARPQPSAFLIFR